MALEGHTRQSPWKKVAWIPYNPSPKFGGDQNHLGGLGKLAQNFQLLCHRKEPWISCFYSTWLTANRRIPGIYSNIVPVYLFFLGCLKMSCLKMRWPSQHPTTKCRASSPSPHWKAEVTGCKPPWRSPRSRALRCYLQSWGLGWRAVSPRVSTYYCIVNKWAFLSGHLFTITISYCISIWVL